MEELGFLVDSINRYIQHKRHDLGIESLGYIDFYTSEMPASRTLKAYYKYNLVLNYIKNGSTTIQLKAFEEVANAICCEDAKAKMRREAGVYLLLLLESHNGEQIIYNTIE